MELRILGTRILLKFDTTESQLWEKKKNLTALFKFE